MTYELQRITNKFKTDGNSIYDLSSEELNEVYDAMKTVYKTIRRATELIRKEGEIDARKAAEQSHSGSTFGKRCKFIYEYA
ncbi:MAG: hypothetical protein ACLTJ5_05225 [Clostridium sp.]